MTDAEFFLLRWRVHFVLLQVLIVALAEAERRIAICRTTGHLLTILLGAATGMNAALAIWFFSAFFAWVRPLAWHWAFAGFAASFLIIGVAKWWNAIGRKRVLA